MKTEIVHASQIQELVINKIRDLRDPSIMAKYREELAQYKRRLGKPKESTLKVTIRGELVSTTQTRVGFTVDVYGTAVPVLRPEKPPAIAWEYHGYDRFLGFTTHAKQSGVLADSRYNRDIRPERVERYREVMEAGEWRDLLSDPITVTDDGEVINGQHRLAAACAVDWSKVENDPALLVIWGVDPAEAIHADASKRTDRDQRIVAEKQVTR
jgi:hypothetical protein